MDKSEHETILSVCFKQSDWLLNNGQPIRDLKKNMSENCPFKSVPKLTDPFTYLFSIVQFCH